MFPWIPASIGMSNRFFKQENAFQLAKLNPPPPLNLTWTRQKMIKKIEAFEKKSKSRQLR
jgi:hypothetical protein